MYLFTNKLRKSQGAEAEQPWDTGNFNVHLMRPNSFSVAFVDSGGRRQLTCEVDRAAVNCV